MPDDDPLIVVVHIGRMANRMFQVMLAHELRSRAGVGRIVGHDLPRWGMASAPLEVPPESYAVLDNHAFDLDHAAYLLRSGTVRAIVIRGWGMRLAYYRSPQPYRELFKTTARAHALRDNELLIHVRGGDILDLHHPYYFPMPFSLYESIIDASGLRPVFIGQIEDDRYSAALRRRFAGAKFLARRSSIEDFETIRAAKHVVLGVSSFGWLAAWLSTSIRTVHMPIFGLFDPRNGQTFLLPLDDERWRFHAIDVPAREARRTLDVVAWAERTPAKGLLDQAQLRELAILALAPGRAAPPVGPCAS